MSVSVDFQSTGNKCYLFTNGHKICRPHTLGTKLRICTHVHKLSQFYLKFYQICAVPDFFVTMCTVWSDSICAQSVSNLCSRVTFGHKTKPCAKVKFSLKILKFRLFHFVSRYANYSSFP